MEDKAFFFKRCKTRSWPLIEEESYPYKL
uniref:Uncharacterized protein n=1 Tax=Rhizophora mucronata TaxID=61149 RepID=A0A2P2Q752_RHIMU